MMRKHAETHLAVVLSFVLATVPSHVLDGSQITEPASGAGPGGATDSAPLSASELKALVAPIALYPDALVAQILSAATFPDQVAIADYWIQQHKSLTGSSLVQAVNNETWDPSVKALTAFPSVLDNMAKNLSWTSSLGEAYHNQSSDVMKAVQALRAQAKAAGTLKSSSQIAVTRTESGTDRHHAGEPAGRLRASIQPRRHLRRALRVARVHRGRRRRRGRYRLRHGNRGRRVDGQRLGMEQMGL